MTPQTDAPPAAPGREANGRFAKGNKFGPGNPFARKVAGLRAALLRRLDEGHMERLADKLLAMALEGDLAAINPPPGGGCGERPPPGGGPRYTPAARNH